MKKKHLVALSFFYISSLFAQETDGKKEIIDSLNSITYLDSATIKAFSSLRICESNLYVCVGIIEGKDTSEVRACDSIIIRATIEHLRDSIFEIHYRSNNKSDFTVGSFKIFTLNERFSLAVPEEKIELNLSTKEVQNVISFIPSSSDSREILHAYYDNGKIIFYECLH